MEPTSPTAGPQVELVAVAGLSKRFAGTQALDSVDFELYRGEIHALLGENGAGKTTLIHILAGIQSPDTGEVRISGRAEPTSEKSPIAFIHQDLGLVDTLTVGENIALVSGYPRVGGIISWRAVHDSAAEVLAAVGATFDARAPVATLTAADKALVAIARALAVDADALILDEPTAALPEADVARLFAVLDELKSRGMGIVYVTHRLDEVFRVADRVSVLRDGRKVYAASVADTTPEHLVFQIVGRNIDRDSVVAPTAIKSSPVLEMEQVVTGDGVGPISLALHSGEILGLVGLRGAGHHTVGRLVFGDAAIVAGEIRLDGADYRPADVATAIRRGVGFVTSKRAEEGLAPGMSVTENVFLDPGVLGSPFRFIRPGAERSSCRNVLDRYDVRPRRPEHLVSTLSGGNQQKVILARWLEMGSHLLVLEEPTFGVDVGSKAHIYDILGASLEEGRAVLLISSDFEEIAQVCRRAIVFNRGRTVAEVPRRELSASRLTALASTPVLAHG